LSARRLVLVDLRDGNERWSTMSVAKARDVRVLVDLGWGSRRLSVGSQTE
jgi:hypothetical protein